MRSVRTIQITATLAVKLLVTGVLLNGSASASDFTAEKVLKEMSNAEQVAYMAGVIEGLAIARYNRDGKKKDGMGCIYDFFYKEKANMRAILDAFEKYPSYPPGSIIDVLVKRKCGE